MILSKLSLIRLLEKSRLFVVVCPPFICFISKGVDGFFLCRSAGFFICRSAGFFSVSDFFLCDDIDEDLVATFTIEFKSSRICRSKESSRTERFGLSFFLFVVWENKGNKYESVESVVSSFFLDPPVVIEVNLDMDSRLLESDFMILGNDVLRAGDRFVLSLGVGSFLSVRQKSNSK